MIQITTLKPDDIGKAVVYFNTATQKYEDGVITSFNNKFIFVRYADQHLSGNGIATRPEDLEFLTMDAAKK